MRLTFHRQNVLATAANIAWLPELLTLR